MNTTIPDKINALIDSRKSLLIASLSKESLPEISATPFVNIDQKFYIFISELASHTQNLKVNPSLSVMLIEDELESKNAFARKRLSYHCLAKRIDRSDENWPALLDKFEEKQGKTVNLLRKLADFHLVELKAISGTYVEGFGKAYRLAGDDLSDIELKTN